MKRFLGVLLLASCTLARPASYEEYLSIEGDAAYVGSLHREVRAPPPAGFATEVKDLLSSGTSPKKAQDGKKHMKNASGKSDEGGYYRTYGSDADGEKGYLKQSYSKGDHGYKSLDTFHKKDGDNYGFETHTAFGKAKKGEAGGQHGKSGSYKKKDGDDDHEGAGTIVDTHYVGSEGDHAGYTDGGADGGDSGHYVEGGESSHYGGDGDGGKAEGYNEHYSTEGGDEGSYESHKAYSTGDEGGHPEGDHYY